MNQNVADQPTPDDDNDLIVGNDPNHDGARKDWCVLIDSEYAELRGFGHRPEEIAHAYIALAWYETREEAYKGKKAIVDALPDIIPVDIRFPVWHWNREREMWDEE